tara:strand:- start:288 stop:491 length:204 start_codon:yes stop_codon:yes gene_type:complete
MTQAADHKQHLTSSLEQQQQILNEIQDLNTQIDTKRELVLKLQGVIEYLQQVEQLEAQSQQATKGKK